MSVSIGVGGTRPPDEKWRKFKAVWDACRVADTTIPDEVSDFFNGEEPDPDGVSVNIDAACTSGHDSDSEWIRVDLKKLPQDVTVLHFSLS